jgi:hypothetical protein
LYTFQAYDGALEFTLGTAVGPVLGHYGHLEN